jgi:hypothetical protein
MFAKIAEIVNRNHNEIRNSSNYFIKVEIGAFISSEIFELADSTDNLSDYLVKNYKLKSKKEYYQYQYQNNFFQRERNFKSQSFKDVFHESHITHHQPSVNKFDSRISLHSITKLGTFSQHMSYHNIVFVNEKIWEITDTCLMYVLSINKKSQNWNLIYFKMQVPLSEQSLRNNESEINKLSELFKHKYDKKYKFHSLDLVLESSPLHQDEVQDNEP